MTWPHFWIFAIVVLSPLSFPGCSRGDKLPSDAGSVSIHALLGSEENYSDRQVRMMGFFQSKHEAVGLFPCAEAARNGDYISGIWVYSDVSAAALDGQWVVIEGVFSASDRGHGGAYAGSVRAVNIVPAGPPIHGL